VSHQKLERVNPRGVARGSRKTVTTFDMCWRVLRRIAHADVRRDPGEAGKEVAKLSQVIYILARGKAEVEPDLKEEMKSRYSDRRTPQRNRSPK